MAYSEEIAGSRSRLLWISAALFLFGASLYLNTLGHGFVFDDRSLILQNPLVQNLDWGRILTSGYRPVRTFTLALNFAVGGENPFGYHLVNLLLHALVGVLIFRLLAGWTSRMAAAAGALVFLAHPVQTAAVAYVSGRKDLLAGLFVVAGILTYRRFREGGGRGWQVATAGLFVLGILSKESALVFPALIVLADPAVIRPALPTGLLRASRLAIGQQARFHALLWVLTVGGLIHCLIFEEATRKLEFWGGAWTSQMGTSFKLLGHYLGLALWPHPLIADYKGGVFPVSTGLLEGATVVAAMITFAFVGNGFWLYRRRPLAGAGMFWFLISLLPVLQLVPFHEIAADHFLYLPLAGLALATADLFALASRSSLRRVVQGALILLLVFSSARTIQRNRDWKTERSLWESTLAAAPQSYRAHVNLGRLYFRQSGASREKRRRGIELTRAAVALDGEDSTAWTNLGAMLYESGRELHIGGADLDRVLTVLQTAQETLLVAVEKDPDNGSALSNLGNCFQRLARIRQQQGESDLAMQERFKARDLYEAALSKDSRRPVQAVWLNYAQLYIEVADLGLTRPGYRPPSLYYEAIQCLRRFLRFFPNQPEGWRLLAHCHRQRGEVEDALAALGRIRGLPGG